MRDAKMLPAFVISFTAFCERAMHSPSSILLSMILFFHGPSSGQGCTLARQRNSTRSYKADSSKKGRQPAGQPATQVWEETPKEGLTTEGGPAAWPDFRFSQAKRKVNISITLLLEIRES